VFYRWITIAGLSVLVVIGSLFVLLVKRIGQEESSPSGL
jgi:hypothetical protein